MCSLPVGYRHPSKAPYGYTRNKETGHLVNLSIKSKHILLVSTFYWQLHVKTLPTNLTQEEIIIEYLKKNNKINRIIVESLLDVSKTRAIDILNNMISNNTLIQSGTGKNTYYMLK